MLLANIQRKIADSVRCWRPLRNHHSSARILSGRGSCVSGASYRRSGVGGTAGGEPFRNLRQYCEQCVHPDDLQQVRRLRDYGVLGERLMSMDGSFELEIGLDKGPLPAGCAGSL